MTAQVAGWLWNHISNEWEKAPAVVNSVRLALAGQVAAGAHKLYWMTVNGIGANSICELSDAVVPAAAVVWDDNFAAVVSRHYIFDPPFLFITGIYLNRMANITSVTFGYI